jgi:adenylate cyclase
MLYGRPGASPTLITEGNARQSENASFPLLRISASGQGNLDNLPPVRDIGLAAPAGVLAREPSVGGSAILSLPASYDYRKPITVSMYFARGVDGPIRLFYWAMVFALGLLGLSLIVAALMAGTIARDPSYDRARLRSAILISIVGAGGSYFRRSTAQRDRSTQCSTVARVPLGRPHFVMRLVKEGRVGAGTKAVLAMMFTDIVASHRLAKNVRRRVADFINQHLSLVAACIERGRHDRQVHRRCRHGVFGGARA